MSVLLMAFESLFLGFLVFVRPKWLSGFVARKACHMVSGLCMILLGSDERVYRVFVYLVTVASLCMTWEIFPFNTKKPLLWFGSPQDVGITIYLLLVGLWFFLKLPVYILAPIFFADPAGAIVGKFCTRRLGKKWNPKIFGTEKTLMGSLAVFLVTYVSVTSEYRLLVSVVATLLEAVGGKFDNLLIALPVIISFLVEQRFKIV
jgi:hypothetical protein